MDFPARLRQLRKAANLSQESLAVACGRSGQGWIGNFEQGKRRPDFDDIPKLAAALGVHPGALFSDLPSQPAGLDSERLSIVLGIVEGAIADSRKRVPEAFKARMIKRVYEGQHELAADTAPAVQAALVGLLESLGDE